MKIATWNINSIRVRLPHIIEWLNLHSPDVLALQETKVEDPHFPIYAFKEIGYNCAYRGQKTYNGVAFLSKIDAKDIITEPPQLSGDMDISEKRFIAATFDDIRIVNLYVVNGQEVDSEKYAYKLKWLDCIRSHLTEQAKTHKKLVVVGDFNIAPQDADIHDAKAWEGKILCSDQERKALQQIQAIGLEDTFRLFDQPANTFSWWDYRAAGFRRNRGLRIDLILANTATNPEFNCTQCWIDKEPRTWERPSDHAPVIAEFED